MSVGDGASRGASPELSSGCRGWVFEWSQGKQVRDPALHWVLLPVAARAAALRLPTSLHAADASPERVLSMTVPARSKTEAFEEGKTSDLGLRIPSEQGLREARDGEQHPRLCLAPLCTGASARAGFSRCRGPSARAWGEGLPCAPSGRGARPRRSYARFSGSQRSWLFLKSHFPA